MYQTEPFPWGPKRPPDSRGRAGPGRAEPRRPPTPSTSQTVAAGRSEAAERRAGIEKCIERAPPGRQGDTVGLGDPPAAGQGSGREGRVVFKSGAWWSGVRHLQGHSAEKTDGKNRLAFPSWSTANILPATDRGDSDVIIILLSLLLRSASAASKEHSNF